LFDATHRVPDREWPVEASRHPELTLYTFNTVVYECNEPAMSRRTDDRVDELQLDPLAPVSPLA
jgi:hypothetical protein